MDNSSGSAYGDSISQIVQPQRGNENNLELKNKNLTKLENKIVVHTSESAYGDSNSQVGIKLRDNKNIFKKNNKFSNHTLVDQGL
jgi:hypothetical protein